MTPLPIWNLAGDFARRTVCKNRPNNEPVGPGEHDAIRMLQCKLSAFWREATLVKLEEPKPEPPVTQLPTIMFLQGRTDFFGNSMEQKVEVNPDNMYPFPDEGFFGFCDACNDEKRATWYENVGHTGHRHYCSDCVDKILGSVIEPDVVFPFTVLLLVPDDFWDGHQSDWVYRAWVMATDPAEAITLAMKEASDSNERHPDEYATLAIFKGHQPDIFTKES